MSTLSPAMRKHCFNTTRWLSADSWLCLTVAMGGKHLWALNTAQLEKKQIPVLVELLHGLSPSSLRKRNNPHFAGNAALLTKVMGIAGTGVSGSTGSKGFVR